MGVDTAPSHIRFTASHQPALPNGEYKISVAQTVSSTEKEKLPDQQHGVTKTFFVAGERFRIDPGAIGGVFPPAYSLGEHSNVFPHIILNRSTLPWERNAGAEGSPTPGGQDAPPWLGLLVVHEEEEAGVTSKVVQLKDYIKLLNISEGSLAPGHTVEDRIQVLQVKKSLLLRILPGKNDLRLLAHVRQGMDDAGRPAGAAMAVLIANRLPKKGGSSTVYLVSLENRYTGGAVGVFDYGSTGEDEPVSLVQLHRWSFTCTAHFKVSQTHLDKDGLGAGIRKKLEQIAGKEFFTEKDFLSSLQAEAKLTPEELAANKDQLFRDFSYGDLASMLRHLNRDTANLRLPDSRVPSADRNLKYLQMGFYPLPHKLRGGEQTVSWYHGPLSTLAAAQPLPASAAGADSLLRYYRENGMFDVSYAAAWQLGRLLALQNSYFSTALYKWKKQYAGATKKAAQLLAIPHLAGAGRDHTPDPLPDSVDRWLKDLALLKGIPFNYLVPDEELLPPESIRFFRLDKAWVHTLLDGALSIGRVTGRDHELDKQMIAKEDLLTSREVSGFILRSEVVAGWPGLQAEGFSAKLADDAVPNRGETLTLLRDNRLSAHVRLCLFEGDLKTLWLHLKPEMLHFGVDADAKGYSKKWRDERNGKEDENTVIGIPLNDLGVLTVSSLLTAYAGKAKTVATSADLAIQLLEGVTRVCFQV